MRELTIARDISPNFSKLSLSLASSANEVKEVQRLRYKVFVEAMGLKALANDDCLDKDEFDDYCDHLIVRDTKSLKVVGTYRIMGPSSARRLGRYYAEKEFDLSRLQHLRSSIAEAGRACVHPDYRNGTVIMLLWAGLTAFMRRERCNFLIGCASISLADGGHNAASIYQNFTKADFAPRDYWVTPHLPFPFENMEHRPSATVPALLKGYLRAGAWISGEPAWDPDFHCADVFVMLPLANLNYRYAKHYGMDDANLL